MILYKYHQFHLTQPIIKMGINMSILAEQSRHALSLDVDLKVS
ncbi:MAG: hypothetical protein ACLSH8_10670 [Zhenhengia sp.]